MDYWNLLFMKGTMKHIKIRVFATLQIPVFTPPHSYHEGLKKWVEIGNSGMFRPEMLRPMGIPETVNVAAWGLSLERYETFEAFNIIPSGIAIQDMNNAKWSYTSS